MKIVEFFPSFSQLPKTAHLFLNIHFYSISLEQTQTTFLQSRVHKIKAFWGLLVLTGFLERTSYILMTSGMRGFHFTGNLFQDQKELNFWDCHSCLFYCHFYFHGLSFFYLEKKIWGVEISVRKNSSPSSELHFCIQLPLNPQAFCISSFTLGVCCLVSTVFQYGCSHFMEQLFSFIQTVITTTTNQLSDCASVVKGLAACSSAGLTRAAVLLNNTNVDFQLQDLNFSFQSVYLLITI